MRSVIPLPLLAFAACGKTSRRAKLRTRRWVAVAACGDMLAGEFILDKTGAEARVLQGVITGIGFIVDDVILTCERSETGDATAAGIRATGRIVTVVASKRLRIAALISATIFLTLRLGGMYKDENRDQSGG